MPSLPVDDRPGAAMTQAERAEWVRQEKAKVGPRLPDRCFETTDWANGQERYPLLILEWVDGGLDGIYGPYTNHRELMAALRHLTYLGPDDEWDDGIRYELQPLTGKV